MSTQVDYVPSRGLVEDVKKWIDVAAPLISGPQGHLQPAAKALSAVSAFLDEVYLRNYAALERSNNLREPKRRYLRSRGLPEDDFNTRSSLAMWETSLRKRGITV